MSSSVNENAGSPVTKVTFSEETMSVHLSDGREIKVPLHFYPKLQKATSLQREDYRIQGLGSGIHWPALDEDLSLVGILAGRHSRPE